MTVLLLSVMSIFLMSSCAHHHKELAHHDHNQHGKKSKVEQKTGDMFDKNCAYSVSEGDVHVKGRADFTLEHGGETYYFSTMDKLMKFKMNLNKSISSAQRNWAMATERR